MINSSDADEIVQEIFDSILCKYQIGLEQSMRGDNFIFDYVSGMHYLCKPSIVVDYTLTHTHSLVESLRKGLYTDSPRWLENKKATINPKRDDGKCFQYAIAIALNHEQIRREPQRIKKIHCFINQCEWKDFPAYAKDC